MADPSSMKPRAQSAVPAKARTYQRAAFAPEEMDPGFRQESVQFFCRRAPRLLSGARRAVVSFCGDPGRHADDGRDGSNLDLLNRHEAEHALRVSCFKIG
jgi:hypothetical protein